MTSAIVGLIAEGLSGLLRKFSWHNDQTGSAMTKSYISYEKSAVIYYINWLLSNALNIY